ncbi:hypothetical protein ACIQOW_10065 [Kitasatospora sp. NPDC091335]|uniref:hypothetical protein n=1 Tax=Kitasatospora sp. NPDC091335 TaxID=3364085 RepID=UPI003805EBF1
MPSAATPSGPIYNMSRAVPELGRFQDAAKAGNWTAIRAGFASLDNQQDIAAAARTVAEVPAVAPMLKAAVKAAGDTPDAVLPHTLLAYNHIRLGWTIRTSYRARHVSASATPRGGRPRSGRSGGAGLTGKLVYATF